MKGFRILAFRDIRPAELLERGRVVAQEQTDQRLQIEFDRRVRLNLQRRHADGRYHPTALLENCA